MGQLVLKISFSIRSIWVYQQVWHCNEHTCAYKVPSDTNAKVHNIHYNGFIINNSGSHNFMKFSHCYSHQRHLTKTNLSEHPTTWFSRQLPIRLKGVVCYSLSMHCSYGYSIKIPIAKYIKSRQSEIFGILELWMRKNCDLRKFYSI